MPNKTIPQLFSDNPITAPVATALIELSQGGVSGAVRMQNIPRLIDLGVVNAVNLINGPQVLYTPSAGEFVQLTVGPDSFVAMDSMAYDVAPSDRVTATGISVPLIQNSPTVTSWTSSALSLVDGRVQTTAPIEAVLQTPTNTFSVLGTPPAWVALHNYAANFLILGPDNHIWSANPFGIAGTSGALIPNFAANEGGTVVDGTVTWTDEGAIPTVGTIHLYALVCKVG